jgi:RNA polymerase sigma-70 factor (ECF subfamily)
LLDEQRQRDASLFDRRREHLRDCLGRLSASQRALIRGYYFDEEAIAALAERTGSGAEAVYKSLQRIRQTLHLCISRKLQA